MSKSRSGSKWSSSANVEFIFRSSMVRIYVKLGKNSRSINLQIDVVGSKIILPSASGVLGTIPTTEKKGWFLSMNILWSSIAMYVMSYTLFYYNLDCVEGQAQVEQAPE